MKKHIPNSMTVLRLFLALAFPFVPEEWRLPVLVVAAATEFLDGFLSRIWDVVSKFGRLLDPIADKAFIVAMLATFLFEGTLEWWEVAVVIVRDVSIVLATSWVFFFGNREEFDMMRPRILGKITTNLQFLFLLSALLVGDVHHVIVAVTGVFSFAAAIDYWRYYHSDVKTAPGV